MEYNPKFSITSKILKSIGQIEASKAIIETSPLLPLYERQFIKDALIRSAYFGTAIEGNKLGLGNVKKIIDGKGAEVIGKERDIKEVINYRKVIDYIENFKHKTVKEDTIKAINRITTKGLSAESAGGKYRKEQNYFLNFITQEKIFTPPKALEVPKIMRGFITYINSTEAQKLHPVLKSGIIHDGVVSIHAFVDGNGRTARACSTLSLYLDGYDIRKFFSLEEYYDRDVLEYYKAIQEGHADLTRWLEYFAEGLAVELARIREKVLKMSRDAKIKGSVGQIYLSERQEKAVEWLNSYGNLKNKDFEILFPNISEDTVLRDLKYLIEKKVVIKRGKTKNARYELR